MTKKRIVLLLALAGILAAVAGGALFYAIRPHLSDPIMIDEIAYIEYHYNPYTEAPHTLTQPEQTQQITEIVTAIEEFRSQDHEEYTERINTPHPDYLIIIPLYGSDSSSWWNVAIYQEKQLVQLTRGTESVFISADPSALYEVFDRIYLEVFHPNTVVSQ